MHKKMLCIVLILMFIILIPGCNQVSNIALQETDEESTNENMNPLVTDNGLNPWTFSEEERRMADFLTNSIYAWEANPPIESGNVSIIQKSYENGILISTDVISSMNIEDLKSTCLKIAFVSYGDNDSYGTCILSKEYLVGGHQNSAIGLHFNEKYSSFQCLYLTNGHIIKLNEEIPIIVEYYTKDNSSEQNELVFNDLTKQPEQYAKNSNGCIIIYLLFE